MKYEKDYIISEIIRTAKENGDNPLGKDRFFSETGIKQSDWYGKYWANWGDALRETGYKPNVFTKAYEENILIEKLISLIRELGKFPTVGDIRIKNRNDKTFPSHTAFRTLGRQIENLNKLIEYCKKHEEMTDILAICLPLLQDKKETIDEDLSLETTSFGFVYLMKSGKFHKIGRSNNADRRAYELKIQLPEKLELIHKIRTDDPIGIEEYWHKRFKDKRKNGEWFELTRQDIEIFKRRKFM